ncbi:hypothetical protein HR060_13260 [Catenovulum sp. SM1970]|uniref:hypothetical protein n=1 Tax=Marinifaba aquimaris TaxID=2741323 RepID=UPI001571B888|nr:hypothetical protein [Marinifaba aquimaris]NTS77823.1 hypothetical protein [Marinifaba aquimaris]
MRLIALTFLLFISLFSVTAKAAKEPVVIRTLPEDSAIYISYLDFVKGKDIANITDFSLLNNAGQREIIEMVLIQQALEFGGLNRPVMFQPLAKFYIRNIHELVKGRFLMSTETVWFNDIRGHSNWLYITDPTIEKGQFAAGLYTSPNNRKAMRANVADLAELTAVSNRSWSADWAALQSIDLGGLETYDEWYYMVKLVDRRMVDFMLAPVSSAEDFSITMDNMKIVPIPHLKVLLPDSRHFAVSKSHKDGKQVFEALNKGLKKLKSSGRLLKAYRSAGVINPRIENWTVVNPHVLTQAPK